MVQQFSSPRGERSPSTEREVVLDSRKAVRVGDEAVLEGDTVVIVWDTESDTASIFVNDEGVARAIPARTDDEVEDVRALAEELSAEFLPGLIELPEPAPQV